MTCELLKMPKQNLVLKFYDHTKGGVDVVDLISSNSSTRMKCRRWTVNALAFILDTVRTNAITIHRENIKKNKMSSFDFTWQLAKTLAITHVHRRYEHRNEMTKKIVNQMAKFLGVKTIPPPLAGGNGKGRCGVCLDEASAAGNYKEVSSSLNHRIQSKCMNCGKFLCKSHQKESLLTCPYYPNCGDDENISDDE